jgi:hypothetical protein
MKASWRKPNAKLSPLPGTPRSSRKPTLLKYTRVVVFDGFYAKRKFVAQTVALGFTMISRLRQEPTFNASTKGRKRGADARASSPARWISAT